jgi:prolyl-tRNA synthetase
MVYAGKELYMKDLHTRSANDKIAPEQLTARRKLYMALFYRQTTVVQR